jgi:hypothetical protein
MIYVAKLINKWFRQGAINTFLGMLKFYECIFILIEAKKNDFIKKEPKKLQNK